MEGKRWKGEVGGGRGRGKGKVTRKTGEGERGNIFSTA